MINTNSRAQLLEKDITTMAVAKVRKGMELLSEDLYEETIQSIKRDSFTLQYAEDASDIAAIQISKIIQREVEKEEDGNKCKLIFNQGEGSIMNNLCDVIVVSKNVIHGIKLVSTEPDVIKAAESERLMNMAYYLLDKYICQTSAENIGITIAQPNLLMDTTYIAPIEGLLEEYDKHLL